MKNVLIVEDDKAIRRSLEFGLKSEEFAIRVAQDGEEGLVAIKEQRPDLILLDVILPKVSGLDVLKEIKDNPDTADIPVIIFSNLSQDLDIERAKKLGARDYFVKSDMSLNEVIDKIKNFL